MSATKVRVIEQGLKSHYRLGVAAAVRSKDFLRVWFISARVLAPSLDRARVGVWASNSLLGHSGIILAVNRVAVATSTWGDGGTNEAGLTMPDDGALQSMACLP